jgi:nitrate reductase beta subunit
MFDFLTRNLLRRVPFTLGNRLVSQNDVYSNTVLSQRDYITNFNYKYSEVTEKVHSQKCPTPLPSASNQYIPCVYIWYTGISKYQ